MAKLSRLGIALIIILGLTTTTAYGLDRQAKGPAGKSIVVDQAQVREILENYLKANRDFLPAGKVRFKRVNLPQPIKLPAGELDVEVIPSDPSILKSSRFTLLFRVNGRVKKNIVVRGEIEVVAPVVVAAADLRRGDLIGANDVKLARMNLADLRNPALDPREVIGMQLKRSVRQGKPINIRTIEAPPIIHRGDLVTITVRKGSLTVTAKGIAGHDAKKGSTIKVRNSSSNKEVLCKVVAPGRVQVEI